MASRLRRESSVPVNFFAFLDIITAVTGILILITLILATDIGGKSPTQTGSTQNDEALDALLQSQSQVEVDNARMRRLIASAIKAPPLPEIAADAADLRSEVAKTEARVSAVAGQTQSRLSEQKQASTALGIDRIREQLATQKIFLDRAAATNEILQTLIADIYPLMQSASNRLAKAQSLQGQSWLRPEDASHGKQPLVIVVSDQGATFTPLDSATPPKPWAYRSSEGEFTDFCLKFSPSSQYVVFLIRPSGIELFEKLIEITRTHHLDVGYDAIPEDLILHVGPVPDDASPTGNEPVLPAGSDLPLVDPSAPNGKTHASSAPASLPTAPILEPEPISPPVDSPRKSPPSLSWWGRLVAYVKDTFGMTSS